MKEQGFVTRLLQIDKFCEINKMYSFWEETSYLHGPFLQYILMRPKTISTLSPSNCSGTL